MNITIIPAGETFDVELDGKRLGEQATRVFTQMKSGEWRTLRDISTATKSPEASVSARLRDLRRAGFMVERRRVGNPKAGLWAYRVLQPATAGAP